MCKNCKEKTIINGGLNVYTTCPSCHYVFLDNLPNPLDANCREMYVMPDGKAWILNKSGDGFVPLKADSMISWGKITGDVTKQKDLMDVINNINQMRFEIADKLPATGDKAAIYLVPIENEEAYEEYIWVDNRWEIIGTTKVDLSNYYKKSEVDNKFRTKADSYNKTEVYNQAESNDLYYQKSQVYTKPEVNSLLGTAGEKNVIERISSNGLLLPVSNKQVNIEVPSRSSNLYLDNVYDKTQINAMMSDGNFHYGYVWFEHFGFPTEIALGDTVNNVPLKKINDTKPIKMYDYILIFFGGWGLPSLKTNKTMLLRIEQLLGNDRYLVKLMDSIEKTQSWRNIFLEQLTSIETQKQYYIESSYIEEMPENKRPFNINVNKTFEKDTVQFSRGDRISGTWINPQDTNDISTFTGVVIDVYYSRQSQYSFNFWIETIQPKVQKKIYKKNWLLTFYYKLNNVIYLGYSNGVGISSNNRGKNLIFAPGGIGNGSTFEEILSPIGENVANINKGFPYMIRVGGILMNQTNKNLTGIITRYSINDKNQMGVYFLNPLTGGESVVTLEETDITSMTYYESVGYEV